jgi:hypothetical protein
LLSPPPFARQSARDMPWQRTEMRRKLLTGRSRTVCGHGGLEVSESDLAALWPLFLNVSTQAARPSLSLLDVEVMIEQRETWKCNGKEPRTLKDAEVEAIETWYESARARDPPAHRLSEIGRHAMKAKIGDAAPRFGRYTQAALGLQYREEGHIASPVKRPRCEPHLPKAGSNTGRAASAKDSFLT